MSLIKGTGDETYEVSQKVTVNLPVSGKNTFTQVKFKAVFRVPVDTDEVLSIRNALLDTNDDYNDRQMITEHLEQLLDVPAAEGGTLDTSDPDIKEQALEEMLGNRFYMAALADACGQALFSNGKRRGN